MRWRSRALPAGIVALSTIGSVATAAIAGPGAAPAGARARRVVVHVRVSPGITANPHISFRPTDDLPPGGYYYAVVVLKPYGRYTRAKPPPCATSSDMQRTDYGYPRSGRPVELSLSPTPSAEHHWCPGGSYLGAVYAVPHPPPCNRTYPCRAEAYEEPSPCFELEGAHRVCGLVARPRVYAYPDGLPEPIEPGTRIVERFHVTYHARARASSRTERALSATAATGGGP